MARPRLDHVRKAQILDAASEVMAVRGFANTRVVDIAKAAGTSPAAILYWFDGKDGLLAQALQRREQEFRKRCIAEFEAARSASDRLRVLANTMMHDGDWALWLELCVLAVRDPVAAAERDRIDGTWHASLRTVIVEGQASGEFIAGDVEATIDILTALMGGSAPQLLAVNRDDRRDRVERMWLTEAGRLLGPGFDTRPLPGAR